MPGASASASTGGERGGAAPPARPGRTESALHRRVGYAGLTACIRLISGTVAPTVDSLELVAADGRTALRRYLVKHALAAGMGRLQLPDSRRRVLLWPLRTDLRRRRGPPRREGDARVRRAPCRRCFALAREREIAGRAVAVRTRATRRSRSDPPRRREQRDDPGAARHLPVSRAGGRGDTSERRRVRAEVAHGTRHSREASTRSTTRLASSSLTSASLRSSDAAPNLTRIISARFATTTDRDAPNG